MIEGAKYEIRRPQDSLLGWENIQIVARREIGTVTTKFKNETRQMTQYEYVALADSDLVVLSEDAIFEDLAMNYSFIGIDNQEDTTVKKRTNLADATGFQRLLAVTISGGKRLTRHNSTILDTVVAIAAVVLIIAVYVALP